MFRINHRKLQKCTWCFAWFF